MNIVGSMLRVQCGMLSDDRESLVNIVRVLLSKEKACKMNRFWGGSVLAAGISFQGCRVLGGLGTARVVIHKNGCPRSSTRSSYFIPACRNESRRMLW